MDDGAMKPGHVVDVDAAPRDSRPAQLPVFAEAGGLSRRAEERHAPGVNRRNVARFCLTQSDFQLAQANAGGPGSFGFSLYVDQRTS